MFMLTESTLNFLNFTWASRSNTSLGGHIQSWRTHVSPQKSSSQQDSLTSATQPPPSVFSNVSKRTSVSSYAPPPPSSKADDTEDLVGAFGDNDLDETLEWQAAAHMTESWVQQPAKVSEFFQL
jgi:hypothetical protein